MRLRRGSFGSGLAWTMIVLMALGIGATTAMFSVINGVLLTPLSLPHPGQLVMVGEEIPNVSQAAALNLSWLDTPASFHAWTAQATDFQAFAALQGRSMALQQSGRPLLLHGAAVTPNFFSMLEVHPALGRNFIPADAESNLNPTIITAQVWRTQFAANPDVIGRTVGSPSHLALIIGVLPPSFHVDGRSLGTMTAGEPAQYFQAFKLYGDQTDPFSNFNYSVIGRLKSGITPAMALAQLNTIQANVARAAHQGNLTLTAKINTLRDYTVAEAQQQLWILLAGVCAVLLVVCVNLGGLWVTRIADRRRDWSIRIALGAAPGRLVRQVLQESVVLAVIGGILGIVCAALSLRFLIASAPADIPRLDQVHLDWRVIAFGLALSVVAGLITGLVPALRLARSDPQSYLKTSGAATTADRSSLRSRQGLIAVQAALSTILLVAVGLLGLSFYKLIHQPTGFDASHAVAADVVMSAYSSQQREQIFARLPVVAAAIPGVSVAAETSHLPLQGETWIDSMGVTGRTYAPGAQPTVNVRFVSPGYFAAAGIPLLRGRDFAMTDHDDNKIEPVVLSRAAVRALWPDLAHDPAAAVGRALIHNDHPAQIVGVVGDVRASLKTKPPSVLYAPIVGGFPLGSVELVVRTTLPAAALDAALRSAIASVAPLAPVPKIRPLAALTTQAVAPQQYQLSLLLLFALVALLLAAIGVYALVSHNVAQRSKELAIRMTMGAGSGDIWGLVVRQALAPVIAGVVAGLIAALLAGRLLASLLFNVSPASAPVLAVVAAAVIAAAVIACLWPAHRATRTDPLAALRAE